MDRGPKKINKMTGRIEGIYERELRHMHDEQGMSQRKIARYYGVYPATISRRMKEYGMEARTISEARRVYSINEDFFKTWTPESSWMYGWILGDGSTKNPYCLPFNLSRLDREVLEKFKVVLESEHPIKSYEQWNEEYQKWIESSRVHFFSKKIVTDLKKLTFYDVPKCYFAHTLRGFFEAEGGVYWHKDKRAARGGTIGSNITQSDNELLYFIRSELQERGMVKGGSINPHGNAWRLSFGIHDSISLYYYLYGDCGNMFLKRKKELFKELIKKMGENKYVCH